MEQTVFTSTASLIKKRGFIFQSGEIYGGSKSIWDYGPLGVELKDNIKKQWLNYMLRQRDDILLIDSSIILPKKVWENSGHIKAFKDRLVESLDTQKRYRVDHLFNEYKDKNGVYPKNGLKDIQDPKTGQFGRWGKVKNFSGLLKTFLGPIDNDENLHFLRPETAQGIFINFKNIQRTFHKEIPFGIAQIGKSFRNEITPSHLIFRTREFEQMEMEFFIEESKQKYWHNYWMKERMKWYINLGIDSKHLRFQKHNINDLSHYSLSTIDIEYYFRFQEVIKWGELEGISNRGNYDLSIHSSKSNSKLIYYDIRNNYKYIPYVIEPAAGLNRALMAFLVDAYTKERINCNNTRIVLKLDNRLAPIKIAVLPLIKKPEILSFAENIYIDIRKLYNTSIEKNGSIGKRYRKHDEIGTPYCITIDYDSLNDNSVTIRRRDSMKQTRFNVNKIKDYFLSKNLI